MSALLLSLIIVPLLGAAVVGYFRNTWSKTMVSVVACSTIAAAFAGTLVLFYDFLMNGHEPIRAVLTTWGELHTLGLVADSLSLWWMLVVTGCGLLIHIYSTGYMHDDPSFGRFMAKMNFFIFAMSLLVLSDNFIGLLMGWANVGLASYMLIGFYIQKPSASAASLKAFTMNMIGEVGMIAGIAFIFMTFGTFSYDGVFEQIHAGEGLWRLNLIGILLLIGAIAKSAQMPLHTWLPNAMEGPTPVSALIHAATMVTAGVYLVSRTWPIYENAGGAAMTVAWVGAIGALFGAVVASGQYDIKRILAFSTLSQIGYMFLGNGLGGFGYIAADFHFMTHAFFKAALFLCAGIVVHHYHTQDIRRMGGLWQKDKFSGWVFLVGCAALIGIPGFAGFFSKDEILVTAFEQGEYALFTIALLAAGMTAFYNVRLFSLVFLGHAWTPQVKALGKKRSQAQAHAEAHHGHDDHHGTPLSMKLPVGILAFLSVVSGAVIFFPHWQVSFLESSFAGLELHGEFSFLVAGLATAAAVIGMGASWYLYGPNGVRREAERDTNATGGIRLNMFYFDEIYDLLIVQPVKGIAHFCANIGDAKIIDGIVDGSGKLAASVGSGLRVLHSGYIRKYALTVFGGVALLIAYFIFYV